jgi:hypothetical protein
MVDEVRVADYRNDDAEEMIINAEKMRRWSHRKEMKENKTEEKKDEHKEVDKGDRNEEREDE